MGSKEFGEFAPVDPLDMFRDMEEVELEDLDAASSDADEPEDHFANLVTTLDVDDLKKIASELVDRVDTDIEERDRHDRFMLKGMEAMGIDRDEIRTGAFAGSSTVRHPLLAQACVDFQSRITRELLPAGGAVRAVPSEGYDEASGSLRRAEVYANRRILSSGGCGYSESLEQAFIRLPLAGSVIRKVRQGPDGAVSETIATGDFAVPYSATTLQSSPRNTHILRLHKHEVDLNFRSGLWKRFDLDERGDESRRPESQSKKHAQRVTGQSKSSEDDDRYVFYEVHCWWAVEDEEEERPYVVVIHPDTETVCMVRRNWDPADGAMQPIQHFVHYRYLPWEGFWGIGLFHLIGGLSSAATGSLRALMDSAVLQNMPTGLADKSAGVTKGGKLKLEPLGFTNVTLPTTGGDRDIRKHFMPLPVAGPSATLFSLLQFMVSEGSEFASVAIKGLADASEQAPVGTTMALVEQGSIVFASIHLRQHRSFAQELRLFQRVTRDWMPAEGDDGVQKEDFDDVLILVTASDPSTWSSVQRVTQAQAVVQMAQLANSLGVKVDLRSAFITMSKALGVEDPEAMFPKEEQPQPPPPMQPQEEFAAILRGQPTRAYPGQNHDAHKAFYEQVLQDPSYAKALEKALPSVLACHADHTAQGVLDEIARITGQQPPEVDPMLWQSAMVAAEAAARLAQTRRASDPAVVAVQEDAKTRIEIENRKLQQRDTQIIQTGELKFAELASRERIAVAEIEAKAANLVTEASMQREEAERRSADAREKAAFDAANKAPEVVL
ncbi:cell envelope integrity protein TolA [Aureimonas sp. AU40]|uniref:cell envelope integrity protein TolA n=1 Tax=Aureimonas sp. AU40 TaxID=1637747 RepID=UPI0007812B1C|nr:hypothetical protein [Aureimonas sp. AU40]